jgi:hypothetical protein
MAERMSSGCGIGGSEVAFPRGWPNEISLLVTPEMPPAPGARRDPARAMICLVILLFRFCCISGTGEVSARFPKP